MKTEFNHFDDRGNAVMVDVSDKSITDRTAIASGRIRVNDAVMHAIVHGTAKKGDVLGVARVAGIMGTKQTSNLIPMCHPLCLNKSTVDFHVYEKENIIEAVCTVKVSGKTGVEMEALMGVNTALLTIYDMCKAMDRSMEIFDIHLLYKEGGKSGIYRNQKKPAVIAVSGSKNSGKTTFIENILPLLKEKGIRTGVIKHDGHCFTPDVPGTDSYRIRGAGAESTAVFCDTHYMVMREHKITDLGLIKEFSDMDLILCEGLKQSSYPKIEIVRRENSARMVCDPENVLAVATDCETDFPVKKIRLNDYRKAADLIESYIQEAAADAGWTE